MDINHHNHDVFSNSSSHSNNATTSNLTSNSHPLSFSDTIDLVEKTKKRFQSLPISFKDVNYFLHTSTLKSAQFASSFNEFLLRKEKKDNEDNYVADFNLSTKQSSTQLDLTLDFLSSSIAKQPLTQFWNLFSEQFLEEFILFIDSLSIKPTSTNTLIVDLNFKPFLISLSIEITQNSNVSNPSNAITKMAITISTKDTSFFDTLHTSKSQLLTLLNEKFPKTSFSINLISA